MSGILPARGSGTGPGGATPDQGSVYPAAGSGLDERDEAFDDALAHPADDPSQLLRDAYVPFWVTDTNRYDRGAFDLHVHGVVGDAHEFCLVVHRATLWPRAPLSGEVFPTGVFPTDGGVRQPGGDRWQCRMLVAVRDPLNDSESVDVGMVGLPFTVRRLQLLEDCDSSRLHLSRPPLPALPLFASLRVVPGVVPHAFPEDWEIHLTAVAQGNECAREVIQSGPNVVDEVSGDERHLRIGTAENDETMFLDVVLALDRYAHLVQVLTPVGVDRFFKIGEVLFRTLQLEQVGGHKA